MISALKGRDFISLRDYSKEEIQIIIDLAIDLKKQLYMGVPHEYLKGKELGMLFFNPSTRTRISFETAISQLGGHGQFYSPEHTHAFFRESWIDTAQVMARYLDGIMIRLYRLPNQELKYGEARAILSTMAANANIPIINASDDQEHPCQVVADIQTLVEKFGEDYKKKRVALVWCCHPRALTPGIPHSLAIAGGKLGMNAIFAWPEGFDPDLDYINEGIRLAEHSGGKIEITHSLEEAVKSADVIYTKSWKLIHGSEAEYLERCKALKHWMITMDHFKMANPGAIYMDAMPVQRDADAASDVIDGPMSVIYDQAENRMHAEKAIMALTM